MTISKLPNVYRGRRAGRERRIAFTLDERSLVTRAKLEQRGWTFREVRVTEGWLVAIPVRRVGKEAGADPGGEG